MAVQVDRSLRLPESEYFASHQAKSGIALHHTVCDEARTTLEIWRQDSAGGGTPKRVATAYVLDRDGTIYEAFDPACWAWQFGLAWPRDQRIRFEQRFIGIEITSEGGLTEQDGKLYAYDLVHPLMEKPPGEAFACGTPYRGYGWFDRYEPAQLDALGRLVDDLCGRFSIPRVYPDKPFVYYGEALAAFEGVIGHAMVRSDKSDPAPDPRVWKTLEKLAGLQPVPVTAAVRVAGPLTSREIESLFARNVGHLNRMDAAAGSLVKALLMELERRQTYLRLEMPEEGAHAIRYDVIQGDRRRVPPLARALGFKNMTDRLLEVRDA
ncbi:MAG TPA: N-acetylmuramoyl-L-alanine amidase [Gemmatimonadales bacterium]|nr:N-acetylmuramoyl-L-alanine amidase [Gemmatimonadales bacterium]